MYALAAYSDHTHIVSYHSAWVEEDDDLYIQLELCENGSLGQRIVGQGQGPDETTLRKVAMQISSALDHLHTRGAVHKDVKPDNIFEAQKGIFKLGDLGLTSIVALVGEELGTEQSAIQQEDLEGDSRYLSREVLQNLEGCDLKTADIFALGASLYELALQRRLPSDGQGWGLLRDGQFEALPHFSQDFGSMIIALMHVDPGMRPTASGMMHEPYLCRIEEIDELQTACGHLSKELLEKQEIERLQLKKLTADQAEVDRLRATLMSSHKLPLGTIAELERRAEEHSQQYAPGGDARGRAMSLADPPAAASRYGTA